MFHGSTFFSMDLGCRLLRESSVRRLRRRAATGAKEGIQEKRKDSKTHIMKNRVPHDCVCRSFCKTIVATSMCTWFSQVPASECFDPTLRRLLLNATVEDSSFKLKSHILPKKCWQQKRIAPLFEQTRSILHTKTIMSVWLPSEMCSWDGHATYLV